VGGAEQILSVLDRALTAAGHRSVVVACEGSQVSGTLRPIPRYDGTLDEGTKRGAQQETRAAIDRALSEFAVDLVHMHGIDFETCLPAAGPPVLVTLHLPPELYPPHMFRPSRPRTYLHCVSASQRLSCPPNARMLPDIPNGVEESSMAAAVPRADFALALGRICPEKGFHLAMDAGSMAGVPVCVAGQVYGYEAHQRYFETELAPRFAANGHRFLGPVGLERKRELLAQARCVLVPSLIAETSSLVAMEALAAGTPVIAFANGALPDIIEHGRTGFLVDNVEAMAEAMRRVGELDPEDCRRAARERFSIDRMTARYLHLYEQLALEPHWEALFDLAWCATSAAIDGRQSPSGARAA
jgi:glycosyltransferase involved in cell wall biosynthesis